MLLDPSAGAEGALRLDLPGGMSAEDVADALESALAAEPVERILIVIGDEEAGIASRDALARLSPTVRAYGDGAGATLPGESLRYRLLRYSCGTCGAQARRVHVDPRDPPQCPNGHGPMDAAS